MGFLLRLPLIVILAGIGALAMVLPGLYAHAQNLHKIGSIFLGAAGLFFLLSVILAVLVWFTAWGMFGAWPAAAWGGFDGRSVGR